MPLSQSPRTLRRSTPHALPALSHWPWGTLKLNTQEYEMGIPQRGSEGTWAPSFKDGSEGRRKGARDRWERGEEEQPRRGNQEGSKDTFWPGQVWDVVR